MRPVKNSPTPLRPRTEERPPDDNEVEGLSLTTQALSDALKRRAPIALEDLQVMIGVDADD